MSEASPSLTARRNRRRFSTRKVLLMLGVLVLMLLALSAGILSYYGYHLVWRFSGFQDVQSIPTSPMPDSPPPEDWLDCRFGPLELTLPPDLVESMDVVANDVIVILNSENESRSLMVVVPSEVRDPAKVAASYEKDLGLPPEGRGLSPTQLRLASYRAGSSDFRWSMSRRELRWHAWCITMRSLLAMERPTRAEYVLRNDPEGILDFTSDSSYASFEWETSDRRFGASIVFKDRSGPLDPTWVRAVCQSVKFSEDRFLHSIPATEKELHALFQVCSPDATDQWVEADRNGDGSD